MNSKNSLHNFIQILVVVESVVLSVYFYQIFPATVATHWGIDGQVNGWGPSWLAAFLLPAILIVMYFLFDLLPRIDPKRENYEKFKTAYAFFKTAIMLVLFGVYLITSLNAIGVAVSVSFWIPILIGLLFVAIGSYMSEVRSNYFVGIRTPWTLVNEEVWKKTHRLGGKLFVIGGLAMMIIGFVPSVWRIILFIAIIILVAIVPIVYSYILYKKTSK